MTRQSLIVGKDRFIIGPWHDDETTAYVRMDPSTNSVPNVDSVQQCMSYLHESGFERALTAALRAPEADVFQHAGFTLNERLHILKHDLRGDLTGTDHRLRRARRNDRPTVLRLDHLAFDDFWHLGAEGLNEALNATTTARFRVLDQDGILGYSVCGRAHEVGYLQRLAVHPDHVRRGLATALVLDALRWLKRRRGTMMLVNTQESNTRALSLYRHLGFSMEPDHLAVMSWDHE